MFTYVAGDISRKRAHYVRIDNFVNKYLKVTFQLGTVATVVYRMGAWAENCNVALIKLVALAFYGVIAFFTTMFTGVNICRQTPIGMGLVVHNFSNINIDAARIGDNLTVNQGVSIGPDWRSNGKPVLGDNVFVGSGARVLGDISIGNNVVIAANALVERSVPDNCTVVGVPARIVSRDSGSQYLKLKDGAAAEARKKPTE